MATYVLIHGSNDSAWVWQRLGAELRDRGHDVVAVDLPCDDPTAGLAAYTDTVVRAIGHRRDIIVVAHSFGGVTGPLVCAQVPVDLLVMLTAVVPMPGERAVDWSANTGFQTPEGSYDSATFYNDVSPALAAQASAKLRVQSDTPSAEPWPLDAWPDVPTRYLLCRDDLFFTPEFVRPMVRSRLGIEPDEIDGGHSVMLSRPAGLADELEMLRRSATRVDRGGARPLGSAERNARGG